jgi:hypothetical protein
MGAVASGNSYAPAAFRAVADSIMRKLEVGSDTGPNPNRFLDLCWKYNDHGYIPTLRCDQDPLYTVLADCYDFEQARRGSPARAYRTHYFHGVT